MFKNEGNGWAQFHLEDNENSVNFRVSYLCDPVKVLLQAFSYLYSGNDLQVRPTVHFEDEPGDLYITFLENSCLITEIRDDIKTIEIYRNWEEVCKEFLTEICQDGFLQDYSKSWYDEDERQECIEFIRRLLVELSYIVDKDIKEIPAFRDMVYQEKKMISMEYILENLQTPYKNLNTLMEEESVSELLRSNKMLKDMDTSRLQPIITYDNFVICRETESHKYYYIDNSSMREVIPIERLCVNSDGNYYHAGKSLSDEELIHFLDGKDDCCGETDDCETYFWFQFVK